MDKNIKTNKIYGHKKDDIIRLENVHRDYLMGNTKIHAVENINLDIHRGEFVAIVGPSGSGKSTMMQLIGALDFATTGDIYLDNVDIEHLHESDLAQLRGRKIGFIFQTFNLIPTLTALKNVMLPMVFQGIEKEERIERATKILNRLNMGPRLNHLPSELSGGEMQRVAIARALANDPEVILADEPTGNLDSKTGEEVVKIFEELNKEGKTIIMVTHDMNMAKHADKIYRLKDGMIVK